MMRPPVYLLLLSGACFLSTEPDLGGMPIHSVRIDGDMAFMGRHELRADTLRVFVTIRNRGSQSARMEFGVCSFAVRGVGPHGISWDNRLPPDAACIDLGLSLDLIPGQSHERLVYRTSVAQLRSSKPAGRYAISIFYLEAGSLRRVAAGRVTL